MTRTIIRAMLAGSVSLLALSGAAFGHEFSIPGGDLSTALDTYTKQTGVALLISGDAVRGAHTKGVRGEYTAAAALSRILDGTGFVTRNEAGAIGIVRDTPRREQTTLQIAQAEPVHAAASVETVVVTSSKIKGDIQTVPIAITALSQEQLTSRQIAGGPDLVKEVPNLTFTKTNFTGYSIQIRGIGTQAISVTTDPAVAVAFNDTPFIRNHFFEQEFYDVNQVEILRGPQGTLYGRNATAGVVNLISAKPTDQFEAMLSADWGNYHNRRYEGMVNIPIVDDRLDIRIAGEWTKRDGYSFNEYTGTPIDGRDLWSGRVTIGFRPTQDIQMYLVWEHFSEDDDRIRSAKQLCTQDPGVGSIDGVPKPLGPNATFGATAGDYFDQGCMAGSLYKPAAFGAPLGYTLPYITGGQLLGRLQNIDPYADATQTPDLRTINSSIDPIYRAKNDVVELNATYALSPSLTFTSQTGFSQDFLYSAEDFNRFGATGGLFPQSLNDEFPGIISPEGVFCDPQLGCSDRLILEDLSQEHAWQASQEFRLESQFSGPFNFSIGGNYLHYETQENYYVFSNVFTLITAGCGAGFCHFAAGSIPYVPNVYDNSQVLQGFQLNDPTQPATISGGYIDPNPLSEINNNGHNYFLSQNPYVLNSYAGFGEANYNISSELKLVAGLRWTEDQKHFLVIPSWLVSSGWGYPVAGAVDQKWGELTGRAVVNWTPKLAFTDQTLVYGSYAHGYKAGGANPPGAIYSTTIFQDGQYVSLQPTHPLTFKPEFVDSFELGTKNTLLDGALTLNGDVFYYNYKAYQVSQIIDRTAINLNFDAHAKGAEIEATWEPAPGLRLNFAGGWEDTSIAKGERAVDLMDRTAGQPGWYVLRPFVNESSNCIVPDYVAEHIDLGAPVISAVAESYCSIMYLEHHDPLTRLDYVPNPTVAVPGISIPAGYPGFDPTTAPNSGAGFSKDLSGNSLPNAPPYTVSFGAQYSLPLSDDWAGTLRGDFYWQHASWWRVFNDRSYDRLRGYANVNLALILTSASGWQVMVYDKNVFNKTAITGAFLNSDDTDLTTNVFLTDPRLIGVRVTKNW